MGNTREPVAEIAIYGGKELRELQAAGKQRVDALEKAVKKADDEYRPEEAAVKRTRLRLWQGEPGEPGILDRIADQMSLYEPAFSSNGREPAGQGDLLEGVDRATPEAETPVVDVQALKALLILTDLTGEVGDEAFEKLDGEVEEHLRTAYLGRAPLELLHSLPVVDAFALYQIVEAAHQDEEGAREAELPDAQALFRKVATLIAQHGATEAPYYEPIPLVQDSDEDERFNESRDFTDEEFFSLTDGQLAAVLDRAQAAAAAAEAQTEDEGPSDAEKRQEQILIHEPATGEDFKVCVEQASLWACQSALQIVESLEGNKVREAAIRKRIAVLVGDPEGSYDLTAARKKAIEVMAAAHDHTADVSNRTAAEDAEAEKSATITRKVAEWLVEEKLAAEDVMDAGVYLTDAGRELAAQLGYTVAQIDEPHVPEGVVEPSDDDIGGPIEGDAENTAVEELDENEWGDGEPVGVGAREGLDGQDDLL